MDFFDPQKQKRHARRLAVGYALIGLALILATIILLYHAYGFGIDRSGRVIRNGLVFVSSRPGDANIYINNKRDKATTNARLTLPSGQYLLELKSEGYRDWKRALTVEGGSVNRFDYAVLFPVNLETSDVKQYDGTPGFSSASLDRRWLLTGMPGQDTFDLFDMDADQPAVQQVTVPPEVLSANTTTVGWEEVEWADDNRHVLLKRTFEGLNGPGSEYILFDRQDPVQSENLSVVFGFTPTSIVLRDQAYDQYYLYDQPTSQLFTASLDQPTPHPYISGVLGYTTEKDIVAYATAEGAEDGEVLIQIQQADDSPMTVRRMPAGTTYLLEMAEYDSQLYLAAGAVSENRVFVYGNPLGRLSGNPDQFLAPMDILKVEKPSHVSFSANKRFVIAQNGDKFAVYDAETDRGYAYATGAPMDAPQKYATWMDGFRLTYVSGGKVVVFDYDGTNIQTLTDVSPSHLPVFDRDYRYMYTVSGENKLIRTALLIPEDL
jgi:hypothetical protein